MVYFYTARNIEKNNQTLDFIRYDCCGVLNAHVQTEVLDIVDDRFSKRSVSCSCRRCQRLETPSEAVKCDVLSALKRSRKIETF